MTKEYKIIAVLIIILILIIIPITIDLDKTICKDQSYCMIYEDDKTKVRQMKFNDNQDYEFIAIQGKNIEKIEGLENHSELQGLDLAYNKISKIQGLDMLNNLESLDLSYNEIKSIDGVEGLESIKYIYLQGNPIKKIENIEKIPSKQIDIYVPFDVNTITQESYDYVKENKINIYFVQNGHDIHSGISDKTIDDLDKI